MALWDRIKGLFNKQQAAPPRTAAQQPQPQSPPNPALQPKRSQAPPEAKQDVSQAMKAAPQAQAQVKVIGQQFQRSVAKYGIRQAQGQHISNAELGNLTPNVPRPKEQTARPEAARSQTAPQQERPQYKRPALQQTRTKGRER